MDVRIAMGIGDFVVVNFGKPIVRGNGSGVRKNQAADRIGYRRIFLDAPVGSFYVAVHDFFVIEQGGFHVANFFAFTAVKDVGLRNVFVTRALQNAFHAVLHIFDRDFAVFNFFVKIGGNLQRQKVDRVVGVFFIFRLKGF